MTPTDLQITELLGRNRLVDGASRNRCLIMWHSHHHATARKIVSRLKSCRMTGDHLCERQEHHSTGCFCGNAGTLGTANRRIS